MGGVVATLRISIAALWRRCLLRSNSTPKEDLDDYYVPCDISYAYTYNSNYPTRVPILDGFINTLSNPQTHIIGVIGSKDDIEDRFIPKVRRRIDRDKVFDVVLTVNVTKKADVKKIQDEIAGQLRFNLNKKSEGERASELLERIRGEKKILIVLLDLYKALDLGKIGIPYDEHHKECKIIFSTSNRKMIASKQMHTDRDFYV